MKKKKKIAKIIVPVALVLVILALLLATFLMNRSEDSEDAAEDDSVEYIDTVGKSNLTVTAIKLSKDDLALSYINDEWVLDSDANFPMSREVPASMAAELQKMNAVKSIENAAKGDLTEYGLVTPELTVSAEYSDGSSIGVTFGIKNDFNGYRYFTVSGDDNVYLCEESLFATFNKDLRDMFRKEDWPLYTDSIYASSVKSIEIVTASGRSTFITDEDLIAEAYDNVYKFNLSSWEDYYADPEEMMEYGISENSDRVTVTYTVEKQTPDTDGNTLIGNEEKQFTVYVGHLFETVPDKEDEEATKGYFYTMQDSTVVYAIDAEYYEALLEYVK